MRYVTQLTRIFYCLLIVMLIAPLGVSGQRVSTSRDDILTSLVETENISPTPLRVGEKLTYGVKLRKLPAGKRFDEVVRKTVLDGKDVYHIRSVAKTRSIFSLYHFRNQQETYIWSSTPSSDIAEPLGPHSDKRVYTAAFSPLRFKNQIEDRKYRGTIIADFRIDDAIEYQKISRSNPKAPREHEIKKLVIQPGTQDELSMLYFLRSKHLAIGKTYFFPLLVKGEVRKVTLTLEREEILKNKALGHVKTLVLRASNGAQLWLTNDTSRIPVKIKAESKIGRMEANLEKIEFVK